MLVGKKRKAEKDRVGDIGTHVVVTSRGRNTTIFLNPALPNVVYIPYIVFYTTVEMMY
jgi:hypothetical protein